MFNQKEFNEFILNNNVLNFFEKPIKLKSGELSNYYFNWRRISNNVSLLEELVEYVVEFTKDKKLKPNCFIGIPEGATKIGLFTQYKWCKENYIENCILPMIRKVPKDHGDYKDKYFVGAPKGKTIIIEDVTTTGSSILEIIDRIRNYELKDDFDILAIFSLVDRRNSNTEFIDEIKYYSLSNASDLLALYSK